MEDMWLRAKNRPRQRSHQILPDPSKIWWELLDPVRFSPNHVEKSPIWPKPVYIMLKIAGIAENVAENLEKKMAGVDGI